MHAASEPHFVGHEAALPSHMNGLQLGVPTVPIPTLVHVPAWPSRLHASQPPPHPLLQQTPSMQKPDTHSRAVAHATDGPFFGWQAPFPQYADAEQVVSVAHDVGQVG